MPKVLERGKVRGVKITFIEVEQERRKKKRTERPRKYDEFVFVALRQQGEKEVRSGENAGPHTISYSRIVDVGGVRGLYTELAFGETCPRTGIRALTLEEVALLRGPEAPALGPWEQPWIGIEFPDGTPILFTTCGNATPTPAESVKAGRTSISYFFFSSPGK